MSQDQKLGQDFFENPHMYRYYQTVEKYVSQQKESERNLDKIHEGVNPKLIALLKRCLVLDPENRASVDELLDDPVFANIRDTECEKTSSQRISLAIDNLKMSEHDGKLKEYSIGALQKQL